MKTLAFSAAALAAAACLTAPMTRDAPHGGDDRRAHPPTGPQVRFAAFMPTTYDATERTVELVLSLGSAVDRHYFVEELEISAEAIDLGRVARGLVPLLDSHNRLGIDAMLGTIASVRFETINGAQALVALASFADTQAGRDAEGMVARGELRGVSIGYDPKAWEIVAIDLETEKRTWRAMKWELLEASLVPVPADSAAGVRSAAPSPGAHPQPTSPGTVATHHEDEDMRRSLSLGGRSAATFDAPRDAGGQAPAPAPAPAPAETRAAAPAPAAPATATRFSSVEALAFVRQAADLGVAARAEELIGQNDRGEISIETANRQLLEASAERQRAATSALPAGSGARVVVEETDRIRAGVPAVLLAGLRRSAGQAEFADTEVGRAQRAAAEPYARHTLSELAALSIGERTMPRSAAERIDVFQRAFHTTSDFPLLLSGALNSRLLENYVAAQPVYRRIARQMTFMDFRAHDVLRPGDFPQLQKVSEAGEIKSGTLGEKRERVYVVPYGITFGLSRQLLVNDNLGAMDQILASQGQSVALFEEITFFAAKNVASGVGPTLAEDGKAVFHADHNNYTSSGTVINTANLGIGRAALRKQKNLAGQAMGIAPAILLVSPDKETEAEQQLATVIVNDTAKANPFGGRLDLVVGGQLTGNAWELYADPSMGANWTWGLLDGFQAPRLRVEDRFGQQGVDVQLEHDFGCGAIDYRFGYRNAGA